MLGKAAILYSADKAGARRVAACLRAAGNDVLRLAEVRAAVELIEAQAVDIIFLDHDNAPDATAVLEAAAGRTPVVALSKAPDASVLLDLVCERGVDNLVARRGGKDGDRTAFDTTEIVVTAEKILRQDLFGLRKYVSGFGIELSTIEVRGAEDRETVVACVQDYVRNLGAGRELSATLGTVADELVTNAIYNAPVDADGRPRYAALDRREKIVLRPDEYVIVEFGSDGRTFGLAVTDRFGRLTRDGLRQGLRRCLTAADPIEQKPGGAGLGLYTVLNSCNQLIINVAPDLCTEVIALVVVDGRMHEVRSAGHSLHLFIVPPAGGTSQDGVPEPSVMISDSMRLDLRTAAAGAMGPPAPVRLVQRSAAPAPPPALADVEELPGGTLLLGKGRDITMQALVGALRDAAKIERAFQTALLFLADRYEGAVLWRVDGGGLKPWCAAGTVADWSKLFAGSIEPGAPCLLASVVKRPRICLGRAQSAPVDRAIARLTAGVEGEALLMMAVLHGDDVRYVLHAFVPRGKHGLASAEATVLHRELTAALKRLGPLAG